MKKINFIENFNHESTDASLKPCGCNCISSTENCPSTTHPCDPPQTPTTCNSSSDDIINIITKNKKSLYDYIGWTINVSKCNFNRTDGNFFGTCIGQTILMPHSQSSPEPEPDWEELRKEKQILMATLLTTQDSEIDFKSTNEEMIDKMNADANVSGSGTVMGLNMGGSLKVSGSMSVQKDETNNLLYFDYVKSGFHVFFDMAQSALEGQQKIEGKDDPVGYYLDLGLINAFMECSPTMDDNTPSHLPFWEWDERNTWTNDQTDAFNSKEYNNDVTKCSGSPPNCFDGSDDAYQASKDFVSTYGTHIIKGVTMGGAIHGKAQNISVDSKVKNTMQVQLCAEINTNSTFKCGKEDLPVGGERWCDLSNPGGPTPVACQHSYVNPRCLGTEQILYNCTKYVDGQCGCLPGQVSNPTTHTCGCPPGKSFQYINNKNELKMGCSEDKEYTEMTNSHNIPLNTINAKEFGYSTWSSVRKEDEIKENFEGGGGGGCAGVDTSHQDTGSDHTTDQTLIVRGGKDSVVTPFVNYYNSTNGVFQLIIDQVDLRKIQSPPGGGPPNCKTYTGGSPPGMKCGTCGTTNNCPPGTQGDTESSHCCIYNGKPGSQICKNDMDCYVSGGNGPQMTDVIESVKVNPLDDTDFEPSTYVALTYDYEDLLEFLLIHINYYWDYNCNVVKSKDDKDPTLPADTQFPIKLQHLALSQLKALTLQAYNNIKGYLENHSFNCSSMNSNENKIIINQQLNGPLKFMSKQVPNGQNEPWTYSCQILNAPLSASGQPDFGKDGAGISSFSYDVGLLTSSDNCSFSTPQTPANHIELTTDGCKFQTLGSGNVVCTDFSLKPCGCDCIPSVDTCPSKTPDCSTKTPDCGSAEYTCPESQAGVSCSPLTKSKCCTCGGGSWSLQTGVNKLLKDGDINNVWGIGSLTYNNRPWYYASDSNITKNTSNVATPPGSGMIPDTTGNWKPDPSQYMVSSLDPWYISGDFSGNPDSSSFCDICHDHGWLSGDSYCGHGDDDTCYNNTYGSLTNPPPQWETYGGTKKDSYNYNLDADNHQILKLLKPDRQNKKYRPAMTTT
jgi:hypothetical protein